MSTAAHGSAPGIYHEADQEAERKQEMHAQMRRQYYPVQSKSAPLSGEKADSKALFGLNRLCYFTECAHLHKAVYLLEFLTQATVKSLTTYLKAPLRQGLKKARDMRTKEDPVSVLAWDAFVHQTFLH